MNNRNNKRRSGKKSGIFRNAKKFSKQGKLGKGFQIDSATYDYFLQVLDLWRKQDFSTEEEKEIFIENTLEQANENEANYSSNQMVSTVFEMLLPFASLNVLEKFSSSLTPSLRILCCDPFASHVIEKLLEVSSVDKYAETSLNKWFINTCKYVLNNFEEFTFDPYGNYVMRKVVQCLAGQVSPSQQNSQLKIPKRTSNFKELEYGSRKQYPERNQCLADFCVRFFAWPQFNDLFISDLTCALVQILLKMCSSVNIESTQNYVIRTYDAIGSIDDFSNPTTKLRLRNLEACIEVANSETYTRIYKEVFKMKFGGFIQSGVGQFSIKSLISNCPDKEVFNDLFTEIEPHLQSGLNIESTIFPALSDACRKFQSNQASYMKNLELAVQNFNPVAQKENFFLNVAMLGQKSQHNDEDTPIPPCMATFPGSLILQNILEFHKPTKILAALFALESQVLFKFVCDGKGSRAIQHFFRSTGISEKKKDKLFWKLKEYLVDIVQNKFGSFLFDDIWAWANISVKKVIADTLCTRLNQLSANQYATFIVEKCALRSYKQNSNCWVAYITKLEKRRNDAKSVFNEIESLTKTKSSYHEVTTSPSKNTELKSPKPEAKHETESSDVSAKKRKHKAMACDSDSNIINDNFNNTSDPDESQKNKKLKKKKQEAEDVTNITLNDNVDVSCDNEVHLPKKKKRKHKMRDTEDGEQLNTTLNDDCAFTSHEEICKPKKKKSKKSHVIHEQLNDINCQSSDDISSPKKKKKKRNS